MTAVYLGVDPGRNGGLAALSEGGTVLDLCKMPDTPEALLAWLRRWNGQAAYAALEKVGGYTKSTGFQPGAHMFTFGLFAGWAEMALVACNVKLVKVPAVRWQPDLDVPPRKKNESKPQFKRRLQRIAAEMFPEVKSTLHTADALLLAEWCRRKFTGKLQRRLFT